MVVPGIVRQPVAAEAKVKLIPQIVPEEIRVATIAGPTVCPCPVIPEPILSFAIEQKLRIEIPLIISAVTVIEPVIPLVTASASVRIAHSSTYFMTNQGLTHQLVAKAGGTIQLGVPVAGINLAVNAENAMDVLGFKSPSPPIPGGPLGTQYQVLFSQLLATRLNLLNGVVSETASVAVDKADQFLAKSPIEGAAGVLDVLNPLSLFNVDGSESTVTTATATTAVGV